MMILDGFSFVNRRECIHDIRTLPLIVVCRTILNTHPADTYPNMAINLLSILERLTTFPTEKRELNEWWVTEIGKKPSKPKQPKNSTDEGLSTDEEHEKGEGDEEDDDWRKFFDEEQAVAEESGKSKGPNVRLHQLTIHQSLHSLSSHKAVFTRAWLTLLSRLSVPGDLEKSKALAARALNLMHRGVMPHLTRPIIVMDWISACVDIGRHCSN